MSDCPTCGHAVKVVGETTQHYEPIGCLQLVDDHQLCEQEAMSNVTINGEPQTWRQLAERRQADLDRLTQLVTILQSLDRCEHGRHEGDDCFGCHGPSKGNPILRASGSGVFGLGQWNPRRIGTELGGVPIVVPPPGVDDRQPANWLLRPEQREDETAPLG